MSDKFWDSDEVDGKYMEVLISGEDGEEYVYWVSLDKLPDDEDEYDWAIGVAVDFHNKKGLPKADVDDSEAMEPFSRNESEFTFIN